MKCILYVFFMIVAVIPGFAQSSSTESNSTVSESPLQASEAQGPLSADKVVPFPTVLADDTAVGPGDPEPSDYAPDYRWQDSHEKERNISFAATAAALIGAVYTGTRAAEARSRAQEKYKEYKGLWYGTTDEEFAQVQSEYNDHRETGNTYGVATAALGALALVGLGFAIYWSF